MSIQTSLARLRAQHNLTQEKLAEQLQISRQAVQKWESGAGMPDLDNIIKIAKRFGVTIDALVLGSDRRICEELRQGETLQPEYSAMHAWESYAANLMTEFQQCQEEGLDIAPYESLFSAVSQLPAGSFKARLADVLFDLTRALPAKSNVRYDEPSDLESIRALSTNAFQPAAPLPERQTLLEHISGSWLGRIAGCLLGKPIEGIHTEELHPLLKESGNWPMHRYILSTDIAPEMRQRFSFRLENRPFADTVSCAPTDDDTNYTVLAQALLDRCGRDFTPGDVAQIWLDLQPKKAYCTAERVAYCNFVKGFQPPASAQWQNPYREWIGAQIRGDYFGYINPGDPVTAAEMAWRDACISHVKNGIYGEMFVAAIIAQAAVEQDIPTLIQAGLGQIPTTSRLYEAISRILADYRKGVSAQTCMAGIRQMYDEHTSHGWCHTISNAMIVTYALLYGGGDYGTSICMAVQAGYDTDCNGATVGSILGMRGGSAAIDEKWTAPLRGTLATSIFDMPQISIQEAVQKTMSHLP